MNRKIVVIKIIFVFSNQPCLQKLNVRLLYLLFKFASWFSDENSECQVAFLAFSMKNRDVAAPYLLFLPLLRLLFCP